MEEKKKIFTKANLKKGAKAVALGAGAIVATVLTATAFKKIKSGKEKEEETSIESGTF